MARRHTRQNPTGSRVNMMQSVSRPIESLGLVAGPLEGADGPDDCFPQELRVPRHLFAEERVHLRFRRVARANLAAALLDRARCFSKASLSHGVGSGVPGVTRSAHFSCAGSWSAVTFGSQGSGFCAAPVSYATSDV